MDSVQKVSMIFDIEIRVLLQFLLDFIYCSFIQIYKVISIAKRHWRT